jgi:Ca-activated chloride channel family protein
MKHGLKIFGILIIAAAILAFTESRTITGKVTDDQGNPLAGVTVSVKGAPTGTITDLKGNYQITTNDQDIVLTFAFIGFSTEERKIEGKSVINVTMSPENIAMDEIVVVGYGAKKDRSVSAAPASYAAAESKSYFQRYNNNFNTEGYASVNENGYKNVKNNPLSTFSIDVDNASYSNIRRFINSGSLPPADAVRIEEMINYFKYDYPDPKGEHPFSVHAELAIHHCLLPTWYF